MALFGGVPNGMDIAGRTLAVYLVLLVGLRIAGKRHTGQLSPHDLVVMLLVSNAVQNAMVGPDSSLAGGLIAAGTLIATNVTITRLLLRNKRWGPLIAGRPALIVYSGRVIQEQLDREGILLAELEAQVRRHGFASISQVRFAVEESDGSISVVGFAPSEEHRLPPKGGWQE